MNPDIQRYNDVLDPPHKSVCDLLAGQIDAGLVGATSKIWHGHPVWFLDDNPIVGYSKQKSGIRLMFWSGADFEEPALAVRGEKFKDASILYSNVTEVATLDLQRWLEKSQRIQWDYKNLIKRKGRLERLV